MRWRYCFCVETSFCWTAANASFDISGESAAGYSQGAAELSLFSAASADMQSLRLPLASFTLYYVLSIVFEFCTLYRTVFGESVHGVINMENEDGFEPTSEFTHLSLPTRYELANGFTSIL
eukprot:COSAG05_NODE_137_length_16843_cov_121.090779_25_plen_121_part_00